MYDLLRFGCLLVKRTSYMNSLIFFSIFGKHPWRKSLVWEQCCLFPISLAVCPANPLSRSLIDFTAFLVLAFCSLHIHFSIHVFDIALKTFKFCFDHLQCQGNMPFAVSTTESTSLTPWSSMLEAQLPFLLFLSSFWNISAISNLKTIINSH